MVTVAPANGLLALPPRLVAPDLRLALPAARRLLRRPRMWRPSRTAEDALVAAAVLDANLGTKAQTGSVTASFVTSAAAAPGSLIVVGLGGFFTGGAPTMTVAGGLTWGVTTGTLSGSLKGYLYYAYAAGGLASGATITWTASGSTDWLIGGASFLGMDSTPTLLATNGGGASTQAWSSGSLVAGETNLAVVMAFEDGSGTATSTSTAPLTELIDFNSAGQTEAFTLAYDLASASTATLAGSWSTPVSHVTRGGAFKIAPVDGISGSSTATGPSRAGMFTPQMRSDAWF
jgi:hypothetical protein